MQFQVLREKGTERAFTGAHWDTETDSIFLCAGCGQELFSGKTKFKSGSGWPSFHSSLADHVVTETDVTLGMVRQEILCSRCGGHLGHVFDDGPPPTGKRFCVNSAALRLEDIKVPTVVEP